MTLSLLLSMACTKATITGTVTDALTGAPIADLRVVAKSSDATDLTCMALEGTTDATGTFSIANVCANNYDLSAGDDMLLLQGDITADGSDKAAGPKSIQAWTAPEGSSVYFLSGGELTAQKTLSDVSTATILGSDPPHAVRYPETRLKTWPELAPGDYLVLTGASNMDTLKLHPVHESPEVKFEPDREDISHWSLGKEWDYIGVVMTEDGGFELKEVTADASKVKDVSGVESRGARYIPADALPAGRYALLKDKSKRTYMFEVK
jgi:hypothetical protein